MENTFYHGDCLFVLQHDIAPESIDLIYLDPPFFTGKVQKGKWQPGAMEVSYEDSKKFWSEKADVMREKAPQWLRYIALKRPDFASYLYYMMERLQAGYTVLKKTGSIYLHCDYRASHYLKMIMDEIWGYDNFRNDIRWRRQPSRGAKAVSHQYARSSDSILFYTKSSKYHWTPQFKSYDEKYIKSKFKPNSEGRLYRIDTVGTYSEDSIKELEKQGRIYHYPSGKIGLIRYLDEAKGEPLSDIWADISDVNSMAKERVGYPTQKPEALLERIIKTSSNEGDLVLDPFCGCGTAVIVASKLNRKFIGIDIDTSERKIGELPTAFSVIKNRGHELFAQSLYVSRDLSEVLEMNPKQFEDWVNEYYRAAKPHPDKGVDGITHEGVPIQVKTFLIKYDVLSKFITDAKYHPNTTKPIKKVIVVSQMGFDDGARKRKFEIETAENIEIHLTTPEEMLELEP